jgi:hypothetical protein
MEAVALTTGFDIAFAVAVALAAVTLAFAALRRASPRLLGGALHTDLWFGLAWGAFPLLTAYFAVAERLGWAALAGAGFALCSSLAQRTLSTEVRFARRSAGDPEATRPLERALQLLSAALPLLAGALLLARAA